MANKGIHDARSNACTRVIQDFTFLFLYFSLFLSLSFSLSALLHLSRAFGPSFILISQKMLFLKL